MVIVTVMVIVAVVMVVWWSVCHLFILLILKLI